MKLKGDHKNDSESIVGLKIVVLLQSEGDQVSIIEQD
jgi:hypothetical protein